MLNPCLQIEHTGSTITQTLAGLWLDSGKKKEENAKLVSVPSEMDGSRLQWLLNGFLFVNVLHLVAICGLGYLDERKRNAQREETIRNEGANEDEEGRAASGSASGIGEVSEPSELSPQSPSGRSPTGHHTTSPLLRPRDVSSVCQSCETQPRPRRSLQDTPLMGATTPAEVRRGKLFASLCATTVVFAWGLFLVTSFVKIRSRREREGHL